jgi:hypothetical protein
VLDALVGNPKYYNLCGALFVCGTPLGTEVSSETLVKGSGMAEAKKLLAESGYDGTPIVIMAPRRSLSLPRNYSARPVSKWISKRPIGKRLLRDEPARNP